MSNTRRKIHQNFTMIPSQRTSIEEQARRLRRAVRAFEWVLTEHALMQFAELVESTVSLESGSGPHSDSIASLTGAEIAQFSDEPLTLDEQVQLLRFRLRAIRAEMLPRESVPTSLLRESVSTSFCGRSVF